MNHQSSIINHHSINCRGKLIDLSTPKIMGILNLTPDSFSDGGNLMMKNQHFYKPKK
jgi:dihydropteroate synthase